MTKVVRIHQLPKSRVMSPLQLAQQAAKLKAMNTANILRMIGHQDGSIPLPRKQTSAVVPSRPAKTQEAYLARMKEAYDIKNNSWFRDLLAKDTWNVNNEDYRNRTLNPRLVRAVDAYFEIKGYYPRLMNAVGSNPIHFYGGPTDKRKKFLLKNPVYKLKT